MLLLWPVTAPGGNGAKRWNRALRWLRVASISAGLAQSSCTVCCSNCGIGSGFGSGAFFDLGWDQLNSIKAEPSRASRPLSSSKKLRPYGWGGLQLPILVQGWLLR